MEVVLGQIEYGGQVDLHINANEEQVIFVLEGNALIEIVGKRKWSVRMISSTFLRVHLLRSQ
jgi:quercetin dioxygenase-like cupin family protein